MTNANDTIKGNLTKLEYFAAMAMQGILSNQYALNAEIGVVAQASIENR